MTVQDEFAEAEEVFELTRKEIMEELQQTNGFSSERIVELRSTLHSAATDFMNAGLELTRDELLSAKILAHDTGYMQGDLAVEDFDNEMQRLKVLEAILDDMRSEELVLGELSADLRSQVDEIAELEKQVEERSNQQIELLQDLKYIKEAKERMNKMTVECCRLEELIAANENLRGKLETQRMMIENEIQSQEHERQEKSRMHAHWVMEKRTKEVQISSLQDELYVAQQGRKKKEKGIDSLRDLIASCKAELSEVKSIELKPDNNEIISDIQRDGSQRIDKAIENLLGRMDAIRESKVRRAVDFN